VFIFVEVDWNGGEINNQAKKIKKFIFSIIPGLPTL